MSYVIFGLSSFFWVHIMMYYPYQHTICKVVGSHAHHTRGGYSSWKGERGYAALKALFSHPLSSSLRPPFHHFSMLQFFKTPFSTKSHIFTKFAILEPKFTKILVPKPQIWQNFSFKASSLGQNQFFKPLFF